MLSPSQGYFFVQKAIEAIIIILTIFKIIKVEDQRKMISSEKFLRCFAKFGNFIMSKSFSQNFVAHRGPSIETDVDL